MCSLADRLKAARSRRRLHMPGHFGRVSAFPAAFGVTLSAWDQTETLGLDALGSPDGVLRKLADAAARVYGAGAAWPSVQGATLPVLAGSLAAVPHGATVVADRLSHRSVLAAAVLGDWRVRWVFGPGSTPAPPAEWARALQGGANLAMPLYPTYEGLAGPLGDVVDIAHRAGALVMVDAAHGAHLGRAPALPPHPLSLGADLVAHGVHKTEPALTQVGVLLAAPGWVQAPRRAVVDEWMRRLGTSSPSYLLLASLEQYIEGRARGDGGWAEFAASARTFWQRLSDRGFSVRQRMWEDLGHRADPAKLTILGAGPVLVDRLRQAGYEPEASGPNYVTLIMGPALGYGAADWDRLGEALGDPVPGPGPFDPPAPGPAVMRPAEAASAPRRALLLADAAGHVAACEVTPYPPGIPAVVPGEVLSADVVRWLREAEARGDRLEGIRAGGGEPKVWVVDQGA